MELKSDTDFKEAIIKTIAFFDLFEYPLTAYEVWKNLESAPRFSGLLIILDNLVATNRIATKNGFYFLAGREEIIATRARRYNYTKQKIKIARRFARLFKLCPDVEMIALVNSLGGYNLRAESDIDFFIITRPGKIWLSRLYCTGLAKILNSRPTARGKKNKICLSFYLSADRLNLNDLFLPGGDPYFHYWRRNLVLLYNKNDVYVNFLLANALPSKNRMPTNLGQPEKLAKWLEIKIMPKELKVEMNNSDGVVINDQILKLYRLDRRREIREKYGNKVAEIIKKDN